MNKYGEITLLSRSYTTDEIGQEVYSADTSSTIQCKIKSIGRNEWATAMQTGFEAAIEADVFSASYNGERFATYNGSTYEIYRTYQDGDTTELYLGIRVGEISE